MNYRWTIPHKLYIAAIILVLSSCYTKKQAISRFCSPELRIKDSIAWVKKDSIYTQVKDSIVLIPKTITGIDLSNICDSLGRLKPFSLTTENGKNKLSVSTIGQKLVISSSCDSTIQHLQSRLQSLTEKEQNRVVSQKTETKTVEKILYRTPWYSWALIVLLSIISAIFTIQKIRRELFS